MRAKIQERLGPEAEFLDRPKGMRWETYARMLGEAITASLLVDQALTAGLEALLTKIESKYDRP